jgi:acyl dehydratase
MSRYWRHVKEQRAGLGALFGLVGTTLTRGIGQRWGKHDARPPVLGTSVRRKVSLPHSALQRDFVRFCGGDPSRYAGLAPPHLFSQWVLPVALRFAERLPYAPLAVVNLGCDLKIHNPLPANARVHVQCTLTHLDVNAERAKITLGLATLFKNEVHLSCDLHLLARLSKVSNSSAKRDRERVMVPQHARELARHRLRADAGLEFAQLTGDFNPIHWSTAYAQMVGFRNNILHGFGSMSLAFEALVGARLSGDWKAIRRVDARFLAPLTLPHNVGVFWDNASLTVGDALGGPAYMLAQVELE